MRSRFLAGALAALVLAACGRGGPLAGSPECGASGFAWVAASPHGGSGALRTELRPSLDVPEAGTAPWEWLALPPNLVRLSDGRIVVADLDENELLVFDATGHRVGTWGRRGAGPGEFRSLAAIGPAGGDSVWAYDLRSLRTTVFDAGGRVGWSASLDFEGAGGFALVLGRVADGRFVVAEATAPGWTRHAPGSVGTDSTRLHLHRPGSRASDVLGWFRTFDVYVSKHGMQDLTGGAPFGRAAAFVVTDSGVFYGFPDRAAVWFHALTGPGRQVVSAPLEGAPVPAADVSRWKQEALHGSSPDFRPRFEEVLGWLPFPSRFPAFRSLAIGAGGDVWLQVFAPAWAATAAWRRFAPDGRQLGTLCAPATFRIARVGDTSLLGTVVDEDGVVHALVIPLSPSRDER